MSSLVTYLAENGIMILQRLGEHIVIAAVALALAVPIGIALGILLSRDAADRLRAPALYLLGLGQTIPSLAVLALGMSLLGIGMLPAIVALLLYAILPIAFNTCTGLRQVPHAPIDAGRGLGMRPGEIIRRVELPLAFPYIIAGIRTSTVVTIAAASLAYLIGGGGLGDFIFTGIALFRPEAMLAGAVPIALLALLADWSLGRLQRRLGARFGME